MTKRILILGASRGIGLETARRALAEGYAVTAFARHATAMPLDHARLTKRDGDALRPEDVMNALTDADAVISALGVALTLATPFRRTTFFSASARILVSAMQGAGVKRLIAVTGFGAGESMVAMSPWQKIPFRLMLGHVYADKTVQETIIRQSGLDWVLARPGMLSAADASGHYHVLATPEEWRNGIISRADVADFLVRQISSDAFLGQAPVLVG